MSPGIRKLALTAHVTASVGWLGAVAASFVLGIAGMALQDPDQARAVYLVLEPMGWFILVPLSLASLLTGLVQSLGTRWGLFRHYWVVTKLVMNVFAMAVLVLYMQTLRYIADLASTIEPGDDLGALRNPSPALHSGAAVVLLLVATALSVYKPRGMTAHGQRKQHEQRVRPQLTSAAQ